MRIREANRDERCEHHDDGANCGMPAKVVIEVGLMAGARLCPAHTVAAIRRMMEIATTPNERHDEELINACQSVVSHFAGTTHDDVPLAIGEGRWERLRVALAKVKGR